MYAFLGTLEDRGIIGWNSHSSGAEEESEKCYNLPLVGERLQSVKCCMFLPICPGFKMPSCSCCGRSKEGAEEEDKNGSVPQSESHGQVADNGVEKGVNNLGFSNTPV